MPSVEEIKLYVSGALAETSDAMAGMRATIVRLDDAINRLRLVTAGSVHPSATEALARLTEARTRVEEAADLARSAVDAAEAYRGLI